MVLYPIEGPLLSNPAIRRFHPKSPAISRSGTGSSTKEPFLELLLDRSRAFLKQKNPKSCEQGYGRFFMSP